MRCTDSSTSRPSSRTYFGGRTRFSPRFGEIMRFAALITVFMTLIAGSLSAQMMASHASAAAPRPTAPAGPTVVTGKPVARVNGVVLTDRDLLREMYAIFPYARQHNGFPKGMEADIRKGALKMIVFEELVYQEAKRRNLTIPPPRLAKAEKDFRKQFHNPDEYQAFVKAEHLESQQMLREKIRRSLLIDQLLKIEVNEKSFVSLAEAKAYYDKNAEKFRVPESFAVQTISVVTPPKATAEQMKEARNRAEAMVKKAKATKTYEEFGLLAEQISQDDYRVMMGDHRAVERSKLPPELVPALLKMNPGDVSDLIQVDQIYTVVRLNAHVPAGTRKFAEVKDVLRKKLQKDKVDKLRSNLNARLHKTAKIEQL